MAEGILMPKAGISVESCIIGEWFKKIGDKVGVGDILFSYETDKAVFECESTASGEILDIFFQKGDEVPCLVNVCAVGNPGEDISALRPAGSEASSAAPLAAAAEARAAAPEVPAAVPVQQTAVSDGAVHASPRAKGLAERSGVDASLAIATGPNGRIIERDVRRLMEQGTPVQTTVSPVSISAPAAAPTAAPAIPEYEDIKFSGIRRAIAKSMTESLSTMAQLTNHFSFDAGKILAYRKELKGAEGDISKITLNDMILFAVSRTLLSHPDLNANLINGDTVRRFRHVNLGIAVDTPRGLMVPTIFGADTMSLLEISKETKALAAQVREGSISPDKLKGGTFTISNLGALGVEMFTPVINPPQTGILGVCGTQTRVREKDGNITTYQAMGLSLSYDHRAVDGAPASRFMADLMKNLESFTALLAK